MSPWLTSASRRSVLTAAATGIPLALVGCLDDGPEFELDTDGTTTLGDRPYPTVLVGDERFIEGLDVAIEEGAFPDPNPGLIPVLTKARFVAEAARDEQEEAFADRIAERRDPLFEPLKRFDALTVLLDEGRREELNASERERLREVTGIDDAEVSLEDDPEEIADALLDDRIRTFSHYPGPPLTVIEAARDRGVELLEEPPDERAADVADEHAEYVRQRGVVQAVVAGARDLAPDAYEDVATRFRESDRREWPYEDETEYADVVAFNAALAAESMLESDGELVTPP